MNNMDIEQLEINNGRINKRDQGWQFLLPPIDTGYADAQIHDYGRIPYRRHTLPWSPGCHLQLNARFSHPASELIGTAGFGFWNAPFADPSLKRPALPQATWFFFASAPNDLPFAPHGPGRGWFAATIDATTLRALSWAPFAPGVLLLNQFSPIRKRLWPNVQHALGISFAPIELDLQAWHRYELDWQTDSCHFRINGEEIMNTIHSPRGPLGFVCWIDNQYMIATANGRFRWGTLKTSSTQWLEVSDFMIKSEKSILTQ